MHLNQQQLEAVSMTDKPLLILAGAGSGKTTVVIERIKNLIDNKRVDPYSVLAITFTNKAAAEMKERMMKTISHQDKHLIEMTTFHSFCLKVLKREASHINQVKVGFKIYSPDDVYVVIKESIKEIGGQYTKKTNDNYINYKKVYGYISFLKNELIDSETLNNRMKTNEYQDWTKINKFIDSLEEKDLYDLMKIYSIYQNKMENYNGLDFDDLIMKTAIAYNENPHILKKYQDRFDYIMVDEFQDTNRAQYAIVHQLAKRKRNIAVVGDDYQSIYAFRGSDIRNILDFDKDFPDAMVVKLEQNYRSSKIIVEAANQLIKNNISQNHKTLRTDNEVGEKIRLCGSRNEISEAEYIGIEIEKLIYSGKYSYSDIAILYRSNRKSATIEKELTNKGIPHKILSGRSFFDKSEVKDIMYYLRYILDPNDGVYLQRIINLPKRGVGTGTISKILKESKQKNILDILDNPGSIPRINQKTKSGMKSFSKLIEKYRNKIDDVPISTLLEDLIKEVDLVNTHYMNETRFKMNERKDAMEQLVVFAKDIETKNKSITLKDFMEELTLDPVKNGDSDGFVSMMTAHASKGLEFRVIFVVGMDQKSFPSPMAWSSEDIEEERRLAYVAFTRAKERLFITYPEEGYVRDKAGLLNSVAFSPSIFVSELPRTHLSIVRE